MDKHPIALKNVFFTKTIVIATPNYQPPQAGNVLSGPQNNIKSEPIKDSPGHYIATMQTKINLEQEVAYPYSIDIECVGIFVVDDTLVEDEAYRAVMITAHSVLYGAIRETVAWITGRHPYGPFVLGLSVIQPTKG